MTPTSILLFERERKAAICTTSLVTVLNNLSRILHLRFFLFAPEARIDKGSNLFSAPALLLPLQFIKKSARMRAFPLKKKKKKKLYLNLNELVSCSCFLCVLGFRNVRTYGRNWVRRVWMKEGRGLAGYDCDWLNCYIQTDSIRHLIWKDARGWNEMKKVIGPYISRVLWLKKKNSFAHTHRSSIQINTI